MIATGKAIELDELGNRLSDVSDLRTINFVGFFNDQMVRIGDLHQQYFAMQAGPNGKPWEPWNWTPTWAPKDHPTLEITGRLRSSLIPGGTDNVATVTQDTLTFGTSVSYAPLLNFGGDVAVSESMVSRDGKGFMPAGTIIFVPAREHVGLSEQFVDRFVEDLADSILEELASRV